VIREFDFASSSTLFCNASCLRVTSSLSLVYSPLTPTQKNLTTSKTDSASLFCSSCLSFAALSSASSKSLNFLSSKRDFPPEISSSRWLFLSVSSLNLCKLVTRSDKELQWNHLIVYLISSFPFCHEDRALLCPLSLDLVLLFLLFAFFSLPA
jgi:hypothetical protein